MKNASISENLKELLARHDNLSLSELARRTNIPQPTLHHLLNGTTKRPRQRVLETLAEYFEVTIAQLSGTVPLDEGIPEIIKKKFNLTTIPLIPWDMLKEWPESYRSEEKLDELILTQSMGKDSFAILSHHSYMEPNFPDHAILVFDTTKAPKDREFVLIRTANEQILCNRIFIEKSGLFIKENESDGDMKLVKINPNTDKIIATLLEVRLQF